MCKPAPPSSKDETITNGLSLEGVHVGTVNLMISSETVIFILFAVFFYFYCKGRRGFCGGSWERKSDKWLTRACMEKRAGVGICDERGQDERGAPPLAEQAGPQARPQTAG